MQETPSTFDRFNSWLRDSVTIKFLILGFLILLLLIPSSMVDNLIYERQSLRDSAIQEISSKWGMEQTIGGPVISVPYTASVKNEKGEMEARTYYAHFLPEHIKVNGEIFPQKKYRGIYVVVLYNGKLHVEGDFSNFNLQALNVAPQFLQFDKAFVSVGLSDMKGIKENILLKWNGEEKLFGPGIPSADIFSSGISVPINLSTESSYKFSFDIDINGSERMRFLPFGKVTEVALKGNWGDPSFEGAFLPDKKEITATHFTAAWKVLQLNRNYAQQGVGAFLPFAGNKFSEEENLRGSFGVKLLIPIDEYQKTMRSSKYAIMFICLTFLTLFFTEILNRKLIHPIQYLLIGFGVVLFYVLLLSISEHLKFDWAYLIAGLSILSLIVFYVWSMLRHVGLTAVVGGVVTVLYLFFYSLLQLEQYALLFGSIGLLLILATVMFLTRNINWYKLHEGEGRNS
ncbi:MAG: cell envelope integrity protein CreD [Chitinophagales bacterium]|nr:cell envelope integrity protein CreD [Chitinophagales bacterium]